MITKRLLALAAACGLWAQIHAPDALASEELRLGVKLPLTTTGATGVVTVTC